MARQEESKKAVGTGCGLSLQRCPIHYIIYMINCSIGCSPVSIQVIPPCAYHAFYEAGARVDN